MFLSRAQHYQLVLFPKIFLSNAQLFVDSSKTSSSLLQALCKQSDMVVDHKHVMVVSSSSTTIKIASIDAIYKIALLSYIHDRRSCIDTYHR